jgi:hypothetical protein
VLILESSTFVIQILIIIIKMSKNFDRRKFLQTSALAGLGLTTLSASGKENIPVENASSAATAARQRRTPQQATRLRVGFIGSGLRGRDHMDLILRRNDCVVVCLADPDPPAVQASVNLCQKYNNPRPAVYSNGPYDYLNMLEKENIDAVIIASPWMWHTQQSIAAMKKGLFVGCEVAGAFSIEECWDLVNAHESTGSHFLFLENANYRRDFMAVLQMVRQNVLGELIHLECGYQHDLRNVKFNDGKTVYSTGTIFGPDAISEARWRTRHSLHRNGDIYPTHGVGPVMNYIDINRGNKFNYLVSMSTKARGLSAYITNVGGKDHPNALLPWKLGDVVTTLIHCNNGEKVLVSHDTNLPRPYSLGFRVQGTKGLWMELNNGMHVEGKSPDHEWDDAEKQWFEKYDHPLWRKFGPLATGEGHGGMDWFIINTFVECAKNNEAPPIDVYDAATMRAITPMSEESISLGSAPVPFPDFTRGRWMTKKHDFAVHDRY